MKRKSVVPMLFSAYLLSGIFLVLYSYTQMDLNLTLSRAPFWQTIQKHFISVGYYQRPLSTALYVGLLGVFFALYLWVVRLVRDGSIGRQRIWLLVLMITGVLVFSYPAFSYDIFNYMFTGRIMLVYGKNPYEVSPLQFAPIDPWLSFMRWTHIPTVYPVVWTTLTIVPYFFGFGYFVLTLFNFKILIALSYLLMVWGVGRISSLFDRKSDVLAMTILAFNPLVIIESLVSSHNDTTMMALALLSMYTGLLGRRWVSAALLVLSAGTKYTTALLVPFLFTKFNRSLAITALCVGTLIVLTQREIQPWYALWILPFTALFPNEPQVFMATLVSSLGLLLRYGPFLYFGHWDPPVPTWKFFLTALPIVLWVIVYLFQRKKERGRA